MYACAAYSGAALHIRAAIDTSRCKRIAQIRTCQVSAPALPVVHTRWTGIVACINQRTCNSLDFGWMSDLTAAAAVCTIFAN